jgi:hypothetical protein
MKRPSRPNRTIRITISMGCLIAFLLTGKGQPRGEVRGCRAGGHGGGRVDRP